jgi:hypothetical protein
MFLLLQLNNLQSVTCDIETLFCVRQFSVRPLHDKKPSKVFTASATMASTQFIKEY